MLLSNVVLSMTFLFLNWKDANSYPGNARHVIIIVQYLGLWVFLVVKNGLS